MSDWKELKKEIEATLNEEKGHLEAYDSDTLRPDRHNCAGWVEALNYVLGRMTFYENKNEEE